MSTKYNGYYIDWDGEPLPTDDEPTIVHCVHESVCPTCGWAPTTIVDRYDPMVDNPASFTDDEAPMYLPLSQVVEKYEYNDAITVQCINGHKATAEPTAFGDWHGWRN